MQPTRVIRDIPPTEGIQDITFDQIEEVTKGDGLSMVEFYSNTCSSCRTFTASLASIAEKFKGSIDMYRVNDGNTLAQSAQKYGVAGHPCVVFFSGGKVLGNVLGAMEPHYFIAQMEPIFKAYMKARLEKATPEELKVVSWHVLSNSPPGSIYSYEKFLSFFSQASSPEHLRSVALSFDKWTKSPM